LATRGENATSALIFRNDTRNTITEGISGLAVVAAMADAPPTTIELVVD